MSKLTAEVKRCSKCKEHKETSSFHLSKSNRDGFCYVCKVCTHTAYLAAKEHRCNRASLWKKTNPEKRLANNRKWREENQDKARTCAREWAQRNRAYGASARAKRRATQLRATPSWANQFIIEEAFDLARIRTEAFGFSWHVDHIIPLRGELVCGLHVENNLRVIPASINLSKGNTFVIT